MGKGIDKGGDKGFDKGRLARGHQVAGSLDHNMRSSGGEFGMGGVVGGVDAVEMIENDGSGDGGFAFEITRNRRNTRK